MIACGDVFRNLRVLRLFEWRIHSCLENPEGSF